MKHASERYAAALLQQSSAEGQRERVSSDLALLASLMEQVPSIHKMLITAGGARRFYELFVSDVAPRMHPLTCRFMALLDENRRLPLLLDIARAFARQVDLADRIVPVLVESAHPLSEALVSNLGRAVGARLGMAPRTTTAVNPDLIGGFIVSHNDIVHDFSLAGAMQQLRQTLSSAAAESGTAR